MEAMRIMGIIQPLSNSDVVQIPLPSNPLLLMPINNPQLTDMYKRPISEKTNELEENFLLRMMIDNGKITPDISKNIFPGKPKRLDPTLKIISK